MAEVLSVEAVLEDGGLVRGIGAAGQLRAAPPSQVQCSCEGAAQLHARPLLKEHAAMKPEYRETTEKNLSSNTVHAVCLLCTSQSLFTSVPVATA
jgi:hypothetical protein